LKGAHGPTPPSVYAIAASQAENGVIVTLARALGREAMNRGSFHLNTARQMAQAISYLTDFYGLPEWLACWCIDLAREAS
jgi:hypothetical protein